MWQTLTLSLLVGIVGGNGVPHFIRGITRRCYPCVFGNGPIPNLIAGWAGLVFAGIGTHWVNAARYPWVAFTAGALGVLLIGLFHAGPGAFGSRDDRQIEQTAVGNGPVEQI
ncbi:hypothetical protein ACFFWC_18610 [Plantactinospora siamensis]|uniref:Uncharacterized protein n=1 Tax=Plantactinospora siamensis TaxID=555372 RepID=A0ABV6P368_9ACTN